MLSQVLDAIRDEPLAIRIIVYTVAAIAGLVGLLLPVIKTLNSARSWFASSSKKDDQQTWEKLYREAAFMLKMQQEIYASLVRNQNALPVDTSDHGLEAWIDGLDAPTRLKIKSALNEKEDML
ncbi:MAG: hypothetical protein OHK0046_47940 [Anaerolineae bacterium]